MQQDHGDLPRGRFANPGHHLNFVSLHSTEGPWDLGQPRLENMFPDTRKTPSGWPALNMVVTVSSLNGEVVSQL